MLLVEAFAAVALALALMGVFGVLSYHVMKMELRLTLAGTAIGIVIALASTELLASTLFGVGPRDAIALRHD